ncbi:hypothetical protein [Picosynechococcus sp. PCC 7117]|uniref:hypothetical protein n=1 Tax=Picosynechococcus sp. PCC 7117 TaxID=195498 RepID=UPI0018DC3191|nr:hypothetical protein [Picosynechococcus sp. PCC 7117]
MQTIVDTSVWSLALRRKEPSELLPQVSELQRLIIADEVVILGLIRQEILSGIRNLD